MGSTSFATETHCHCGTAFKGSDHCPECHCEQFEAVCDHKVESERERASRLAGMLYDAILAKGGDYNTAATASLYLHESLLNAKLATRQNPLGMTLPLSALSMAKTIPSPSSSSSGERSTQRMPGSTTRRIGAMEMAPMAFGPETKGDHMIFTDEEYLSMAVAVRALELKASTALQSLPRPKKVSIEAPR